MLKEQRTDKALQTNSDLDKHQAQVSLHRHYSWTLTQFTTRLSQAFGPPSGQDASGGARTRDRRVPADLRADSLATLPPTPLTLLWTSYIHKNQK
ncbi:hypothetical protein PoB_006815300 [Plakobranchus ocellatus]|uniref:Uncharacterized protein n=1 Tax=Plakobranchus ocellatus TaxID=259542 RepID=A0AAV4DC73_9GAST|nr:hypothetical protein PoB_006815300 [Plakobranchus ocellatus]